MGRKRSWFSAIKRVFTPHSKENPQNGYEKRSIKEKNKGIGKLRHGEANSFIPLFREPSSVEKIFLDFEREQQSIAFRPSSPQQQPITPPFVTPRVASPRSFSPRTSSARRASPVIISPPRVASSPWITSSRPKVFRFRPEPTLRNHHASATKIQAAYRGYVARRSFRALKGLVRLQGVVRGQNVKRQTMNAMKQMQLLVRVQSQIQSRRIQMVENQARHQLHAKNDKEVESALGKWSLSQPSEAGNQEDWDDSFLTREEIEARLQKKAEAIVKRERAMAYAYSHQLWKASPNSAQAALADIRSAGFPWWWNWLERPPPPPPSKPLEPRPQTLKNFLLAPPTPQPQQKQAPRFQPCSIKQHLITDSLTPKSTKSTILPATRPSRNSPSFRTPPPFRTPPATGSTFSRYSRPRDTESPFDHVTLKDDDSLTSCPPFSVPHYMAPTASAKAKLRAGGSPVDRFVAAPASESKRKMSLGFASFKWNKGSLFSNKDSGSGSQRILDKNQSLQSIGNLSVDSTVSLPAEVGRKPFNRFV